MNPLAVTLLDNRLYIRNVSLLLISKTCFNLLKMYASAFLKSHAVFKIFRAMMGAGVGSALMPDGNALGLHFVMFVPTIMGQVSFIEKLQILRHFLK